MHDKLIRFQYLDTPNKWNDIALFVRILDLLKPDMRILDLGASAGIVKQMNFCGKCAYVCGVNLDLRVAERPWLDDARISNSCEILHEDKSFDIVFANNVMEHLAQPEDVWKEANRVLRTGGRLLFKTPSKNHYMPLITRCTPHQFHQHFNQTQGTGMLKIRFKLFTD